MIGFKYTREYEAFVGELSFSSYARYVPKRARKSLLLNLVCSIQLIRQNNDMDSMNFFLYEVLNRILIFFSRRIGFRADGVLGR